MAVDIPPGKATPTAAGEPVEATALSQMGATFAERAAAAAKAVGSASAENKSVSSDEADEKATSRKRTSAKSK